MNTFDYMLFAYKCKEKNPPPYNLQGFFNIITTPLFLNSQRAYAGSSYQ